MSKLSFKIFSAVISATLILGSISFGAFAAPNADLKSELSKVKNNTEKNMQIKKEKEQLLAAKTTMTKLINKNETFTMNILKNNMVRIAIKRKQDGKMVLINELIIDNGKIIANKQKDIVKYMGLYRASTNSALKTSSVASTSKGIDANIIPSPNTNIVESSVLNPSLSLSVDDPKTNLDNVYGYQLKDKLPITFGFCRGNETILASEKKILCDKIGYAKTIIHGIDMYTMDSPEAKKLDEKYGLLSFTFRNGKMIDTTKEQKLLIVVDVELRNDADYDITSMENKVDNGDKFDYDASNYTTNDTEKILYFERLTPAKIMPKYNNSEILNSGFTVKAKSSFRTKIWLATHKKPEQITHMELLRAKIF